jgi:hypothetical protein
MVVIVMKAVRKVTLWLLECKGERKPTRGVMVWMKRSTLPLVCERSGLVKR